MKKNYCTRILLMFGILICIFVFVVEGGEKD